LFYAPENGLDEPQEIKEMNKMENKLGQSSGSYQWQKSRAIFAAARASMAFIQLSSDLEIIDVSVCTYD